MADGSDATMSTSVPGIRAPAPPSVREFVSFATGYPESQVGANFGEDQSGDEFPHSKVYQVHTDSKLLSCFARPLASAMGKHLHAPG